MIDYSWERDERFFGSISHYIDGTEAQRGKINFPRSLNELNRN